MYTPRLFELDDLAALHAQVRAHPFALLITPHAGEVHLTHLPFHLEARGVNGTLEAHLARANPHCAALLAGAPSTVVFRGPDAYVSPRWYQDPKVNVPTWNYVAIHAHGRPIAHEDPETILAFIGRLTDEHEAYIEEPWSVREAQAHAASLTRAVLAFELPIDSLEGKSKLSQNRSPADRKGVMEQFRKSGQAHHREMLELMDALYLPDGQKRPL